MTTDPLYHDTESDISLVFAKRYCELFVNRFRRHGLQKIRRDGRPHYQNNLPGSVKMSMVYDALNTNRKTYAGYGVDAKGGSKWTMFDIDIPRSLRKLIEETHDPDYRMKLEELAWNTTFLMADRLMSQLERWDLKPVPIFSGGKGLHVYILFNKRLKVEKAVKLGVLMKYLTHIAEEGQLDEEVFNYLGMESYPCLSDLKNIEKGGLPHLVKLPLMLHRGSNAFSRFMYRDKLKLDHWRPHSDLESLETNDVVDVSQILEDCKVELEEALNQAKMFPVEAEPTNHPSADTYLRLNIPDGPQKLIDRCVGMRSLAVKVRQDHHLDHDERLFILFTMLAFAGGEGDKTVHAFMKHASDYDFNRTQYFIDHARQSLYKPFLCENAQAKGICPLDEACDAVGRYRTPLGVVTGFDADNRSQIQPVLDDPTPAYKSGSIPEIKEEIKEKLFKYLRESPEKALLFQVDPGVGKTVTTAKALADLPDDLKHYKKIFWAGQRHELYSDVAKYIPDLKQIKPKVGSDYDDDAVNIPDEKFGLCYPPKQRKLIRMMREKGWAIIETEKVCIDCDIGIQDCDYFNQWDHRGSFFAPHQHLTTERILKNKIKCDLIVIDENPASVFDGEVVVTQEDIDDMIEFIQSKKFARNERMVSLLENLRRTVTSFKKLTQGHELIKALDNRIRLQKGQNPDQADLYNNDVKDSVNPGLHHLINEIDKTRFWVDWEAFIELAEPADLPKNWLTLMFKAVKQQKLVFGVEHNSQIYVKKQKSRMVLGLMESKTFTNEDTPVVCLDATAELKEYKRLIKREFIHIYRKVKMLNPVYQLIDGEYPMQSIVPDNERTRNTRMKLLRFAKAIIEKGEKTLVVSTMQFHDKHLIRYLKHAHPAKKYVTDYYHNLRGSNEYEECDQIVLIGVSNPNMEELHIREQARRLHEDYLSNETVMKFQRYGESKIMRKTRFYEDERMNNALIQKREYEMIQAINRIRPLLYPEKKIWILSAIPLSLTADINHVNSDELSILLGLKLETKNRPNHAYKKLTKAVINLRHNHHTRFTIKKLADTAGVNQSTTKNYSRKLCEDIQYLFITKSGFEIQKNSENQCSTGLISSLRVEE